MDRGRMLSRFLSPPTRGAPGVDQPRAMTGGVRLGVAEGAAQGFVCDRRGVGVGAEPEGEDGRRAGSARTNQLTPARLYRARVCCRSRRAAEWGEDLGDEFRGGLAGGQVHLAGGPDDDVGFGPGSLVEHTSTRRPIFVPPRMDRRSWQAATRSLGDKPGDQHCTTQRRRASIVADTLTTLRGTSPRQATMGSSRKAPRNPARGEAIYRDPDGGQRRRRSPRRDRPRPLWRRSAPTCSVGSILDSRPQVLRLLQDPNPDTARRQVPGYSKISTLRRSNCGGEVRSRHRAPPAYGSTS